MGTFKIVEARPADIGPICAIQTQCRLSGWTVEGYRSEMARSDSIVLAARSGSGKILGFIAGRTVPATHGPRSDAEIYNLGVVPAFQNRGIGSMLLRQFIEASKRHGVDRIWLDVRVGNGGAIEFYRNHGFLGTGRRKAFYTDPADDAEIMCLRLGDSDT